MRDAFVSAHVVSLFVKKIYMRGMRSHCAFTATGDHLIQDFLPAITAGENTRQACPHGIIGKYKTVFIYLYFIFHESAVRGYTDEHKHALAG
jgi:hypothetical protein